jgi:hypothetical protein
MTARSNANRFASLARLQDLAVLESRRVVELAVAETDAREQATKAAQQELALVERAYVELHAQNVFCPVRMQVAAAILNQAGDLAEAEDLAWHSAQDSEAAASADWQRSQHRAEWFADQARTAARRDQRQRDAKAEDEVRGLRIALGQKARL